MNEAVDITLEDYQALLDDAERYAYLKQWARQGRGHVWHLGVTLFTNAGSFDAAVDEARQHDRDARMGTQNSQEGEDG